MHIREKGDDNMEIRLAENIRALRKQKQLTQEQLAEVQSADKSNTSKQNNIFKHIFGQDKK